MKRARGEEFGGVMARQHGGGRGGAGCWRQRTCVHVRVCVVVGWPGGEVSEGELNPAEGGQSSEGVWQRH